MTDTICKHITCSSRLYALLDGGRYYDQERSCYVCPWCDDWDQAIRDAEAAREDYTEHPERYGVVLRSQLDELGWGYSVDDDGVLWLWPPHEAGDVPPAALEQARAWRLRIETDNNGVPVCRAAHLYLDHRLL